MKEVDVIEKDDSFKLRNLPNLCKDICWKIKGLEFTQRYLRYVLSIEYGDKYLF